MEGQKPVINASEAAQILRDAGLSISPERVRFGIQQKEFPWGNCILDENGEKPRCYVYVKPLTEWMIANGLKEGEPS